MIVTPRDIIAAVVARDVRPFTFKPWDNGVQRNALLGSMLFLIVAVALGYASKSTGSAWLKLAFIAAITGTLLCSVLYQVSTVLPAIAMLRRGEDSLAESAIARFDDDVRFIAELTAFEAHHLEYARDRLAAVADHLRQRMSFLFGAADKVGVVPSAVVGFFYARGVVGDPKLQFDGVEGVFAGLVLLYLMAVHSLLVAQRVERQVLVLKHACAAKHRLRSP